MIATNMAQLEKMLIKQLDKAMNVASLKMEADLMEQIWSFYSSGTPTMYVRTGALGDTPKVTPLSKTNNIISFNIYLDDSHNYTTGDNPSMAQVLQLADRGIPWITKSGATAKATAGRGGFWERSEKSFQKTLDSVIASFF